MDAILFYILTMNRHAREWLEHWLVRSCLIMLYNCINDIALGINCTGCLTAEGEINSAVMQGKIVNNAVGILAMRTYAICSRSLIILALMVVLLVVSKT